MVKADYLMAEINKAKFARTNGEAAARTPLTTVDDVKAFCVQQHKAFMRITTEIDSLKGDALTDFNLFFADFRAHYEASVEALAKEARHGQA